MKHHKLRQLRLEAEGYLPHAPDGEAAEIDRRVCEESECKKCGRVGLIYDPWVKKGSYLAYAVCPDCGESFEF